jgi:hypothetical protein
MCNSGSLGFYQVKDVSGPGDSVLRRIVVVYLGTKLVKCLNLETRWTAFVHLNGLRA